MPSTIKPPSLTELADSYNLEDFYNHAKVLSPESARILDKILIHNPLDIINRARLLDFYYIRFTKPKLKLLKDFEQARLNHIFWFIDNVPDCRFAGNKVFELNKETDKSDYLKVSKHWQNAIQNNPDKKQIKINAALFYFEFEPQKAMQLVLQILDEDSTNAWAITLGKRLSRILKQSFPFEYQKISDQVLELDEETKSLLSEKQIEWAFRSMHRVNIPAAKTLENLLLKYPSDLSSHLDLMRFYADRCKRLNRLGIDPEYEELFAKHYLWFVRNFPGTENFQQIQIPALSDRIIEILKEEWNRVKDENRQNKHIGNNRTNFNKQIKPIPQEKKLKLIAHRKKQNSFNFPKALDDVAILPKNISIAPTKPETVYSLTQWANDCAMDSGSLTGAYRWFSPKHVLNLTEILGEETNDFFHVAMLVTALSRTLGSDETSSYYEQSFLKFISLLVSAVPDCDFLSQFCWKELKVPVDMTQVIHAHWLKTLTHCKSSRAHLNAALCFWHSNKKMSEKLIRKAVKLAPDDLFATALLQKLEGTYKNPTAEYVLDLLEFKPGHRSDILQKTYLKVNHVAWLATREAPLGMFWTLEQLLQNNPNDLLARNELFGLYDRHTFCFELKERDKNISTNYLRHVVWFIQNVPETLGVQGLGDHYTDPLSYEVAVLAWKKQIRSTPKNASVAVNAAWSFYGTNKNMEEGIKLLSETLKHNKGDYKLLERRKHLKELLSYRPQNFDDK